MTSSADTPQPKTNSADTPLPIPPLAANPADTQLPKTNLAAAPADTQLPKTHLAANPADTPQSQTHLAANKSDAAAPPLTPQIRLRAIEPEDLDLLYAIENDPALWSVAASSAYYSRFMLKQYIAAASNDIYADSQLRLIAEIHFPPPTHKCAERFPRENTHPSPH